MTATEPRYTKGEFAERGDAIYERRVESVVGTSHAGQFVAIDIETEAFEVDADELTASDHLLARVPTAQVWVRRIGSRYMRRFGVRPRAEGS